MTFITLVIHFVYDFSCNIIDNGSEKNSLSTEFNNLFVKSEYEYNHKLALESIKLSVSAFSDEKSMEYWGENTDCGREKDVKMYLEEYGFYNLKFYNYDVTLNDSSSKVAYATGEKLCNSDTVIIAIVLRGGRYGLEWADNFNVGKSDTNYHMGFYNAAHKIKTEVSNTVFQALKNYNVKIWITGYSRGGAVANILSALITEDKKYERCQVYAYTFASPKTTIVKKTHSHDDKYKNIFNILSPNDPVYNVPPSNWGFGRFGICVIFPDNNITNTPDERIIRDRVYEEYRLRTGKTPITSYNFANSLVNVIIKSSDSRDFFSDYLAKPLSDLITVKMFKDKSSSGHWQNISQDKIMRKMYGEDGVNEVLNVKNGYFFNSIKKMGINIPDDFYLFIALCKLNGYSGYESLVFNSINISEFYNLTLINSGETIYTGHTTPFYISWLTRCPPTALKFVAD